MKYKVGDRVRCFSEAEFEHSLGRVYSGIFIGSGFYFEKEFVVSKIDNDTGCTELYDNEEMWVNSKYVNKVDLLLRAITNIKEEIGL